MSNSTKLASHSPREKDFQNISTRRIVQNAMPWLSGLYTVMVPVVYREILRVMFLARSMNW